MIKVVIYDINFTAHAAEIFYNILKHYFLSTYYAKFCKFVMWRTASIQVSAPPKKISLRLSVQSKNLKNVIHQTLHTFLNFCYLLNKSD